MVTAMYRPKGRSRDTHPRYRRGTRCAPFICGTWKMAIFDHSVASRSLSFEQQLNAIAADQRKRCAVMDAARRWLRGMEAQPSQQLRSDSLLLCSGDVEEAGVIRLMETLLSSIRAAY